MFCSVGPTLYILPAQHLFRNMVGCLRACVNHFYKTLLQNVDVLSGVPGIRMFSLSDETNMHFFAQAAPARRTWNAG